MDPEKIRKETLRTLNEDPVWIAVSHVPEMVSCLVFLYRGKFVFESGNWIEYSLEIYDYLLDFSRICLEGTARVLVIYQTSGSGAQDSGQGVQGSGTGV